jgi:hypothetical protein
MSAVRNNNLYLKKNSEGWKHKWQNVLRRGLKDFTALRITFWIVLGLPDGFFFKTLVLKKRFEGDAK